MWRIFVIHHWPTVETKVDSHTDEAAAIWANDHEWWFGNDFADKFAMLGAGWHRFPIRVEEFVTYERPGPQCTGAPPEHPRAVGRD